MVRSLFALLGLSALALARPMQQPLRASSYDVDRVIEITSPSVRVFIESAAGLETLDRAGGSIHASKMERDAIVANLNYLPYVIDPITSAVGALEISNALFVISDVKRKMDEFVEQTKYFVSEINGTSEIKDNLSDMTKPFSTAASKSTEFLDIMSKKSDILKIFKSYSISDSLKGYRDAFKALGKALGTVAPGANDDFKNAYKPIRDKLAELLPKIESLASWEEL